MDAERGQIAPAVGGQDPDPALQISSFPLVARIMGWLVLGITCGLALICAIGLGIMLNRAPFNQITTVWVNLLITYTVFLFILIISSLIYYPKGSVEEHIVSSHELSKSNPMTATKRQSRGTKQSMVSRVFFCSRKEIIAVSISVIVVSVCVLLGTALMFPEAYRNTQGLRMQKIGSVDATRAKFFLRDASANLTHVLQYRLAGTGPWTEIVFTVDPSRDFTRYVTASGLTPSTTYTYRFDSRSDLEFNFTTAPVVNSQSNFSFYFGSCFLYNVPNLLPAPGWGYVDKALSERDASKSFIMFMGDYIYSDHPWYKGQSREAYFTLYRQVYTNPHIERTLSKYPSFFIFDDHEIYDNWDDRQAGPYLNAMDAWDSFLGLGNPDRNSSEPEVRYYDFSYGDSAFFVLDTRSHRSPNTDPEGVNKTMLGATQKQRLFSWLLQKNSTSVFKFLVSSVGWTEKLSKDMDGWGKGFATERAELFDFIRVNNITGCVFLSADSHFAYGPVHLDHKDSGFMEFSASPLSAFSGSGFGRTSMTANDPNSNESIEFFSVGGGAFVSLLGVIDVDTTVSEPYFNVSFYEGTELISRSTIQASKLVPKP